MLRMGCAAEGPAKNRPLPTLIAELRQAVLAEGTRLRARGLAAQLGGSVSSESSRAEPGALRENRFPQLRDQRRKGAFFLPFHPLYIPFSEQRANIFLLRFGLLRENSDCCTQPQELW